MAFLISSREETPSKFKLLPSAINAELSISISFVFHIDIIFFLSVYQFKYKFENVNFYLFEDKFNTEINTFCYLTS